MVTRRRGDHFVMYRNIKSLCCTPGTNSVIGQSIKLKKNPNKLIGKEIRFVVAKSRGWGKGNWMKVVKGHKPPAIR